MNGINDIPNNDNNVIEFQIPGISYKFNSSTGEYENISFNKSNEPIMTLNIRPNYNIIEDFTFSNNEAFFRYNDIFYSKEDVLLFREEHLLFFVHNLHIFLVRNISATHRFEMRSLQLTIYHLATVLLQVSGKEDEGNLRS